MSDQWTDRLSAAFKPLRAYEESTHTGDNEPATVVNQWNEFMETLAKIGVIEAIIGIEGLGNDEFIKFGDYREALKEYPIAIIRMSWAGLQGSKKSIQSEKSGDERMTQLQSMGLKVQLDDADPEMLLKLYLPEKPNDPVATALKKRYQDKPVIAFRDDGTVAETESIQYISDLELGFPACEAILVDGRLTKLYPVGFKPSQMVDEDPLFPGKPLRNGYSIVNHRNWSTIKTPIRQRCRIIMERGDIDPNNADAVRRLLELAMSTEGEQALESAYPEADMDFRMRVYTLPQLKVELGSSAKPQNPFGISRKY